MLDRHRARWSNIYPTLRQNLVYIFAGLDINRISWHWKRKHIHFISKRYIKLTKFAMGFIFKVDIDSIYIYNNRPKYYLLGSFVSK